MIRISDFYYTFWISAYCGFICCKDLRYFKSYRV